MHSSAAGTAARASCETPLKLCVQWYFHSIYIKYQVPQNLGEDGWTPSVSQQQAAPLDVNVQMQGMKGCCNAEP
jgi:hypothetical protein